jgi:hypothetical protein
VGGVGANQPGDGRTYDFFIAHAGPDGPVAERLFDLLAPTASVFLDSRSLVLGDDFDVVLASSQRSSEVTLVLVSGRTEKAFYQREEIAAAIDLARGEHGHRVVPIYLTSRRELGPDLPYGLRLKHGIEISASVSLDAVAAELLKLRERLRGLTGTNAASPERVMDVDAVFSSDPTLALPAAASILERGELPASEVVARLRNLDRVQIFVLRKLLSAFPAETGPPMVERILAAGSDWQGAVQVARCLTPAHAPHCADALGAALDHGNVDVVRLAIRGLGYVGADGWGWRIARLLKRGSEYEYGKYAAYAVEARARMVVLFDPSGFDPGSSMAAEFAGLEDIVGIVDERGWPSLAFMEVTNAFGMCRAMHADELVKWLGSERPALRELAASALGDLRMRRTHAHVAQRVAADDEVAAVKRRAVLALGAIGGPGAVALLEPLLDRYDDDPILAEPIRHSLAGCLADAGTDDDFERLAVALIDDPWSSWRVYRAIGLRGAGQFESRLRRGLEAIDGTERGAAALGLARLRSNQAAPELTRAYEESVTPFERVMTALALVRIAGPPPSDPDLTRMCADLTQESYAYDRLIRDDIVAVLTESEHPRASRMVAAWGPIYAEGARP